MKIETKVWILPLLVIYLFGCGRIDDRDNSISGNTDTLNEVIEDEEKTSYLSETYYDGKSIVDKELYAVPFRKSDKYISNKELSETVSAANMNKMVDTVEEYINILYSTGYRQVVSDQEKFRNTLFTYLDDNAYYTDGNGNVITADEYVNMIIEWIVDNHIIAEIAVTTDRSLVYSDMYYYVRCKIDIQNYGDQKIPAGSFMPVLTEDVINVFEKKSIYCDIALKLENSNDYTSGKIVSINVINIE